MPAHPFLQTISGGSWLRVKVQPRASRTEVAGVLGDELKIRITAPPVDSAANQALIEFLATKLDCPRGAITLVRGQRSSHKVLALNGILPAEAAARLLAPG